VKEFYGCEDGLGALCDPTGIRPLRLILDIPFQQILKAIN
jgi:hypothetical protein